MEGNAIPINENTTVILKSSGDLFLQGQEQGEVRFQNSEDRIRVNHSGDHIYIETHASLDLSVPMTAKVVIEKVGGSAFVQELAGPLVVQKVGGDLALQRLVTVRIEKVGGSCLIEGVSETLSVNKIGGDLTVRQVSEAIEINSIGGTGDIQLSKGGLAVRAGGNLRVYINEALSGAINLRAGASISLYLPADVNASFNLNSGAESIHLSLKHQPEVLDRWFNTRRQEFVLGSGDGRVEAQAGADIRISDEQQEPASITGELERRENAWVDARDRRGSPSWSGGFGFDRTSAWADMISRRAQEAARRAEQRSQAAVRRAEEQIRMAAERDMRRSEYRGRPVPPPPPPSNITENERLMVLQMLQDQKISVEQAEKLLAALEGRFDG
jgi:hypothetical protein